ncbi:MAG: aminodeoxychorismate synthase component I [Actinomycetota bacterium]|nr:aminodeoxychorismate synthase component I [Actinomycetota bacterium]
MFGARFDDADSGRSFVLRDPHCEIVATELSDVTDAIERVSQEAAAGRWVAGYVAYEAAPAFDGALVVREDYDGPLVWFGVFGGTIDVDPPDTLPPDPLGYTASNWVPSFDRDRYGAAFAAVRRHIALGDSYQINLTFRMHATLSASADLLYASLVAAQHPRYAAHLWHGDTHIVSVSPEQFFSVRDMRVTTRPMKGTAPRGRWAAEDEARRLGLESSEKDRAENLMIVDLVRNDLGRIAEFGSVQVDELFKIEQYRTVWQMTSQVAAVLRPGIGLVDVFGALFPCGSVTGAPKARSMAIIAEQEPGPRGVYCGAVGFVPPGDGVEGASFNVAIRTAVVDQSGGSATYGVGGGVTWDSDADAEYDEALAKALVLTESGARVELLETIRWEDGYVLLEEHLERLRSSAAYWAVVCDVDLVRRALLESAESLRGPTRVSLVLSGSGAVSVALARAPERFSVGPGLAQEPVRVRIDLDPLDSSDPRLFHKLTDRGHFDDRRSRHRDVDDVLCVNEHGHVTESTIANVVFLVGGEWLTPPVADGLLPGILRSELLDAHTITERSVTIAEARVAEAVALINSVRGWWPAVMS